MNTLSKNILCLAAAVLVLLAGAQPGFGQNVTSGTITGVVTDAQKGVLPGATVIATHTPTGTTYEAVTQGDGHFTMMSVRVGGPYTIKATMAGFRDAEQTNIMVALGEARSLDFTMTLATVTETVNVVAEAQVIDTQRAGTASNIASQAIESLPTISRSINDFARTSPYFNVTASSAGYDDAVQVAGRNNRYNNMQIDGAVNNDVFGLAASGTPGGQTSTQPVSLDAIQEIQLLVSPYDVRQGGFSGGGINAVTKSGSNAFHGTAYYLGRNQKFIGTIPGIATNGNPNPADTKVGKFSDKQLGFSVGGPVMKNKAFFFANLDWARKTTPVGFSADGTSGQQFSQQSYVQQVIDVAKSKYNYDPGGLGEVSKANNSNKIFGRVDFNIGTRNQLTIRENYVDALADVGGGTQYSYTMPSNYYHMTDKMLSSVVQLNSSFGKMFNELRVTYQRERNLRGGQPGYPNFPQVQVNLPDGNSMYFGTEYSSHANALNQDIVQVSDDITLVKGTHTFSFGTQNEFYKFYNVFIQYLYGGYRFSSLANFQAGIAQSYTHNYSNDPSDPVQAARFSVQQVGFYAGDKWRVRPNFTLTYGVRIDKPHFSDTPHNNPLAITDFGYSTAVVPAPTMFSPRVGFNWDLSKGAANARSQIRGGLGLFTGRTPYVWLSNQYSNTGVDFTNLSVSYNATTVRVPFVADPNNQPTTVAGGATGRQTINVIDPNYKYPEVLRGNLAFDHDLPFGMVGTAEFLFTRTLEDINYQNLNYIPSGTLPDGMVTVKKLDSNLNDVLLLSNTKAGRTWTTAFSVERPFRHGFYFKASYLYGQSFTVNDGTSSVARSNWANNPYQIYTNYSELDRSSYDPGHRVNFAATFELPRTFNLTHRFSVFYNGMSGRRYSLGFYNDINGDGAYNELLFVPVSSSQVVVTNGTWDQLNAYLTADPAASKYAGQIMPRGAGRAPWMNQMDIQYSLNIPTGGKTKAEVTLNIFNFLNLLNKNWGWQYWASFPMTEPITYGGIDKTTGLMIYNINNITASTWAGTFTRDDLRSRWQAQLGIRFRF
jgi:hypothetical protein